VDDQLPEIAYPSVCLLSTGNLLFSYQDQTTSPFLGKNVYIATQELVPELTDNLSVPNVDIPTKKEELTMGQFRLYPTVTTGKVKIELGNNWDGEVMIKIFDMASNRVYNNTVYGNCTELNISNLAKGMYLVSIQIGNQLITRKIIKM
jgi:hypothetical protein